MMFNIVWSGKPAFWKKVDSLLREGIVTSTEKLLAFFLESSVKYLAGPPYEDATLVDG